MFAATRFLCILYFTSMRYSTFWPRAGAALIDSLILSPLIIIDFTVIAWPWLVASAILQHAYTIIGHALYGQTVGKRIVGIMVVRAHEHLAVRWSDALLRETFWIATTIGVLATERTVLENYGVTAVSIAILCNILITAIHPRNRGIHDFIGATVVIRLQ